MAVVSNILQSPTTAPSLPSLQITSSFSSNLKSSTGTFFLSKTPLKPLPSSSSSSSSSSYKYSKFLRRATLDADLSGGGGGGGDAGEKPTGGGGDDGEGGGERKKMAAMSMSQKLTIGYAALVGVGGIMGFVKSGSQKSLAAGALSALGLLYVYSELPVRPTYASTIGLGLSAALLVVMGSRFKRSKKIFPAGVVSLVSFIMAGGYFHGILRGLHA